MLVNSTQQDKILLVETSPIQAQADGGDGIDNCIDVVGLEGPYTRYMVRLVQ